MLVDSEPISNRILCEEINSLGLDISYEETRRRFVGLSFKSVVEAIEKDLGHPVPEGWVDAGQARTFEAFKKQLRPVEGIFNLLDVLEKECIPYCVASSGAPSKMQLTLGLTDLLPRFEGKMFSSTMVANGKPAPDLFLFAAQEMAFDPSRTTVIEDSVPGVQAGKAAGMRVLAYAADPFSQRERLAQIGGEIFDDMADVPRLLT